MCSWRILLSFALISLLDKVNATRIPAPRKSSAFQIWKISQVLGKTVPNKSVWVNHLSIFKCVVYLHVNKMSIYCSCGTPNSHALHDKLNNSRFHSHCNKGGGSWGTRLKHSNCRHNCSTKTDVWYLVCVLWDSFVFFSKIFWMNVSLGIRLVKSCAFLCVAVFCWFFVQSDISTLSCCTRLVDWSSNLTSECEKKKHNCGYINATVNWVSYHSCKVCPT